MTGLTIAWPQPRQPQGWLVWVTKDAFSHECGQFAIRTGVVDSATGFRFCLVKSRGIAYDSLMKSTILFTNCVHRSLGRSAWLFVSLLIGCYALLPTAQAVDPPPDGDYPGGNTAEGQDALFSLTTGTHNTAVGWRSLSVNTTGRFNTAVGAGSLFFNGAEENTATGTGALFTNFDGGKNTATGAFALYSNLNGMANTAVGSDALPSNRSGASNTAVGGSALFNNTTGGQNTALGQGAGFNQTTGSGNVYIGVGVPGVVGESTSCYIASIFNQTSASGIPVLINSSNKLGTTTSSKRFKEDIKSMDNASEVLFSLKPVTFRYKKDIDAASTSQFGLVAEDVEAVNPGLVVRDKEGKPYSVRYDQVNAMLLNEFLKAHQKMEEQGATIAKQQKQIEALTAGLQKVSDQLELSKRAPQVVNSK